MRRSTVSGDLTKHRRSWAPCVGSSQELSASSLHRVASQRQVALAGGGSSKEVLMRVHVLLIAIGAALGSPLVSAA